MITLCKSDGPGTVSSTGTHSTADSRCQEGMTKGSLLLYLSLFFSSFPKHLFRDGLKGSLLWRSERLHKATGCSSSNSFLKNKIKNKIIQHRWKPVPPRAPPKTNSKEDRSILYPEQENKKKPRDRGCRGRQTD